MNEWKGQTHLGDNVTCLGSSQMLHASYCHPKNFTNTASSPQSHPKSEPFIVPFYRIENRPIEAKLPWSDASNVYEAYTTWHSHQSLYQDG